MMVQGSRSYNILYYVGKYIFVMFLVFMIMKLIGNDHWLISLALIPIDYLVLKISIIGTLETTENFKIRKSDMEIPFIIFTFIALLIMEWIFQCNFVIFIALPFAHAIMFKAMDANNEIKIENANKAMDDYFLTHPKKQKKNKTKSRNHRN